MADRTRAQHKIHGDLGQIEHQHRQILQRVSGSDPRQNGRTRTRRKHRQSHGRQATDGKLDEVLL